MSEATKTCPASGRERGACISDVAKGDLGKPHAEDPVVETETEGGEEVVVEGDEPVADVEASVEATDTGPSAKAPKASKASNEKGGGGGKGRGGKG